MQGYIHSFVSIYMKQTFFIFGGKVGILASAKSGITKKVNRLDTNQWSWSEALVDSLTDISC